MPGLLVRSGIKHLDFRTVATINKEVVSLTGDKHEFDEEDEGRIRRLLKKVENVKTRQKLIDLMLGKASVLVYGLASGQYFHEGNKRTALVAGLAFVQMNGFTFDIRDAALVEVVDRAGIRSATLNEVKDSLRRLIRVV